MKPTTVKELADQLTPVVRAAMPPALSIATRPFLWAVVRIVVWVVVALYAPALAPIVRVLITAFGPMMREDFLEWLRSIGLILSEYPAAPEKVEDAVWTAYSCKAPVPWNDQARVDSLAASFNRMALAYPGNLASDQQRSRQVGGTDK